MEHTHPSPEPSDQEDAEVLVEQQAHILQHVAEIGTTLRLNIDPGTLLQRICNAACGALYFQFAALYLIDQAGMFQVVATAGLTSEQDAYLRSHPLPLNSLTILMSDAYRLSESYFIPSESTLWQQVNLTDSFVIILNDNQITQAPVPSDIPLDTTCWQPEDLFLIPLRGGNNELLGFLTPDAPLDECRPTVEKTRLFELFANQAAVSIEGSRLYQDARRSSEERAVLVEVGRALSEPEVLRDQQKVYQIVYEQIQRVMPVDTFYVSRVIASDAPSIIEFLIDHGIAVSRQPYEKQAVSIYRFLKQHKKGLLFHSWQEYLEFLASIDSSGQANVPDGDEQARSLLFVPIIHGARLLGFLSVQHYQQYSYTQGQMRLLEELTMQAGLAIANARLYAEQREALELVRKSEQLKDQFLMTASHELRTPLTAIQGYLELLGEYSHNLDAQSRERFILNARRACEELVLLLGNVMDASRIEQDRVYLKRSPVSIWQSLQVITEILEPLFAREKRELDLEVDESLLVWADDLRLRQILLNLVNNALKYTAIGTKIAIKTELLSREELKYLLPDKWSDLPDLFSGHFVIITIRDWGQGIALEDQPKLFTRFIRLSGAMNSPQRGAGLGLYLCRQLTEAMGGYIWMESQGIVGKGSTFFVALPFYSKERLGESR